MGELTWALKDYLKRRRQQVGGSNTVAENFLRIQKFSKFLKHFVDEKAALRYSYKKWAIELFYEIISLKSNF